jgi:glycerophosphoryl diester phosphodiesterase
MMRLIAHRGRFGAAAENGLDGLRSLPGPGYGIEVDARVTRDGVAVLHHDADVGRTTDGEGAIADLTIDEVQRLRLADGSPVPTLQSYLAACVASPASPVLIDVKSDDPSTVAAVVSVVDEARVRDRCVLLVRSVAGMAAARSRSPDLALGCLRVTLDDVDDKVAGALEHGARVLFVHHGDEAYLAHRAVIGTVRAAGLTPAASTLHRPETVRAARRDGCAFALVDVLPPGEHTRPATGSRGESDGPRGRQAPC